MGEGFGTVHEQRSREETDGQAHRSPASTGARSRSRMRRMTASRRGWLREPLVHFVALGALLFVAFAIWSPGGSAGHRIVVDDALVNHLAETFTLTWQR